MQEIFLKQGITYLDELQFQKDRVRKKVIQSWSKNRDPSRTFLSTCFEEELKQKKHPKVEVKRLHSPIGYGVFALEDIGTHRFVGEYTGVIRKRTFRMIFRNYYCALYPAGFDSLRTYVIDAEKQGNFTRFINHSYDPNLEMKSTLHSDGLPHLLFIAKRLIHKGDELTMDYGKRFWRQVWKRPK